MQNLHNFMHPEELAPNRWPDRETAGLTVAGKEGAWRLARIELTEAPKTCGARRRRKGGGRFLAWNVDGGAQGLSLAHRAIIRP